MPQHRHRNQFGQVVEPGTPEYEEIEMTEQVINTPHNPVTTHSVDSNGDVVTDSSGAPAVNTVAEIQQPAVAIETVILTIDGAGDLITDPTAPGTTELFLVVPTTTGVHKKCRVSWLAQDMSYVTSATSDVPFASYAQATINYTDEANAISRLTVANAGASATATTAASECLPLSAQNPEVNFDVTTTSTASFINNAAVGAYPPTDAGQIPVYISVVFY